MLFPLLLGAKSLTQIHQTHAQIILNALPLQTHLLTKLINSNFLDYARLVFDHIPHPNDFSWNFLIRAYTLNNSPQASLFLYHKMLKDGKRPTNFTYPFVLKACSVLDDDFGGEQVHGHVCKMGFECDLFVGNSLIDMYCKCGRVRDADKVFGEMPERDEVSWNSMVSGYVRLGVVEKARELFEEMPLRRNVVCWTSIINGYGREGNLVEMLGLFREMLVSADEVEPNSATMVCLLSACSTLSNFEVGRWVLVFVDVNAIPINEYLCTALIDLYSKCGDMEKALSLFDRISSKTLASWNAIMTGYVLHGLFKEVIKLYRRMQAKFLKPDEITMVKVLSACAGLGAVELGREIHVYLGRNNLRPNVILSTTLVDMYSKCGKIYDACLVFIKTSKKDLPLWNAMIMGLAYNGLGRDSLAVFRQMERAEAQPNDITFIGVLSTCNRSGFVQEGRMHFSNMIHKYKLSPQIEHYACMVDLLGRVGHLEEAYGLVQSMNVPPDSIIWGSLLRACQIHRNLEVADKVGEVLMASQEPNFGFCNFLSNIYASVGRWNDVARMSRLVKEKKVVK